MTHKGEQIINNRYACRRSSKSSPMAVWNSETNLSQCSSKWALWVVLRSAEPWHKHQHQALPTVSAPSALTPCSALPPHIPPRSRHQPSLPVTSSPSPLQPAFPIILFSTSLLPEERQQREGNPGHLRGMFRTAQRSCEPTVQRGSRDQSSKTGSAQEGAKSNRWHPAQAIILSSSYKSQVRTWRHTHHCSSHHQETQPWHNNHRPHFRVTAGPLPPPRGAAPGAFKMHCPQSGATRIKPHAAAKLYNFTFDLQSTRRIH